MPKYYFNVRGLEPSIDNLGENLSDDEAAWAEAMSYAGALFKDINVKLRPGKGWDLIVKDETGREIYQIRISSKAPN